MTFLQNTSETGVLILNGRLGESSFVLSFKEPDVIGSIERFDSSEQGVRTLIELGACAMRAVSTGFDVVAVRKEIDRAVDQTTAIMETYRDRISEAVSEGGPLASTLAAVSIQIRTLVQEVVTGQGDAEVPGSLVARIQNVAGKIDVALVEARKAITDEMRIAADRQTEAIMKATHEMRDLDPASAIGGAFDRLERGLTEVRSTLAANQATSQERLRGTAKGGDFEELVASFTAQIAVAAGDRAERTGAVGGMQIVGKGASKRGDITCPIAEGINVVLEVMNREGTSQNSRQVIAELEEAIANRGAQAGIAVMASADNNLMLGQPFVTLNERMWVVLLDQNNPDLLPLRVAYQLARRIALGSKNPGAKVDIAALVHGVEEISTKLQNLAQVKVYLGNIVKGHDNALLVVNQFERDIKSAVERLLDTLNNETIASEAA